MSRDVPRDNLLSCSFLKMNLFCFFVSGDERSWKQGYTEKANEDVFNIHRRKMFEVTFILLFEGTSK